MTLALLAVLAVATWVTLVTVGLASRVGASRAPFAVAIAAAAIQVGAGTGWLAARGYPVAVGFVAGALVAVVEIGSLLLFRRRQPFQGPVGGRR